MDTPLTTVEKAALLIEVDLFQEVPSDALAELATLMDESSHEPGDVLHDPQAPDARLSVVVDGQVRLQRPDAVAQDIGRGGAFGLLAALGVSDGETATAVKACRILSIASDDYVEALADSTALALANLRALARRLHERDLGVSGPDARRSADGDTR
jgi:CRP-like cAMP-binding protein